MNFVTIKKFYSISTSNSQSFYEWLAGLIDGDGYFYITKQGYACFEITMSVRDINCLKMIQYHFGGNLRKMSNIDCYRYVLSNQKGLKNLILFMNGLIRNPKRLEQINKICNLYGIVFNDPQSLTFNNGWLLGFIDSDGSVYLDVKSDQVFITASQKDKYLLEMLPDLFGGKIYSIGTTSDASKWTVYRKKEVKYLLQYFSFYPLKSAKHARILLLAKYFDLRSLGAHRAEDESDLGIAWNKFLTDWSQFKD